MGCTLANIFVSVPLRATHSGSVASVLKVRVPLARFSFQTLMLRPRSMPLGRTGNFGRKPYPIYESPKIRDSNTDLKW